LIVLGKKMAKKRNFSDIFYRYKTYDDSHGRGNVKEWNQTFTEKMNLDEARKQIKNNNPLSVMGFNEMPTIEMLNNSYRNLMKIHHPDRGGDPIVAKKIIAAYTVLSEQLR